MHSHTFKILYSNEQTLVYNHQKLLDENYLSDYHIKNESLIHVVIRLRGDKPIIYLYPEIDNFDVKVRYQ